MRRPSLWPALVASAVSGGCLSPAPPPPVRYFTPPPSGEVSGEALTMVELGPVTRSDSVEQRMTWRLSPVEIAFDDLNRWAEDPRELVQRAVRRALASRESGSPALVAATAPWRLQVHADNFELVRPAVGDARSRVVLVVEAMRGDARATTTITAQQPAASGSVEDHVRAMGAALADAAKQTRDWSANLPR